MNVNVNFMEENVIQINGGTTINVSVSVKKSYMRKDYVWNLAMCSCQNGKYLASITDDSVIICDELIYAEEKKIKEKKKITCKTQDFYILLIFL